jgi:hypothetical protein
MLVWLVKGKCNLRIIDNVHILITKHQQYRLVELIILRFILVRYWYSTNVDVEHFERRCCLPSYADTEPNVNANPIAIPSHRSIA